MNLCSTTVTPRGSHAYRHRNRQRRIRGIASDIDFSRYASRARSSKRQIQTRRPTARQNHASRHAAGADTWPRDADIGNRDAAAPGVRQCDGLRRVRANICASEGHRRWIHCQGARGWRRTVHRQHHAARCRAVTGRIGRCERHRQRPALCREYCPECRRVREASRRIRRGVQLRCAQCRPIGDWCWRHLGRRGCHGPRPAQLSRQTAPVPTL
jgi:hypothetical protein